LNDLARHGVPVRQRPPIEVPFLRRLERYRDEIAKAIYAKTRNVSDDDLNSATETLINRLVFVRFAEDRDILQAEDLKAVVTQWRNRRSESLIAALNTYFEDLDRRFNGRLFAVDDALLRVKLDNEVLADIIEDLYPPRCPYRFNQIRVELLGDIYERHLGKIILHRGRGIRIEEKPEVRHAKGVYYTPTYIVDGILERTLRPLLQKCDSIEDIFKLKGVDPACGSGSFLLGAYRMIHDEILERAVRSKRGGSKFLEVEADGAYRLKFKVKRRILEECLHGVDIDRRAVRVAELSLYLKLLEDEPDVSKNPIPYLPELKANLQCGNSLIDMAMLPQGEFDLSDSVFNRINPFTWERKEAFGRIMKSGRFSWVMGNPPYIRIQALRTFSGQETDIIRDHYDVVGKGNPDIYVAFIRRSIEKLQDGGVLGFIVSNKFTVTDYGEPLRKFLSTSTWVSDIVDFGHKQVFEGATTHTCILVVHKKVSSKPTAVRVVDVDPSPSVLLPHVVARGVRDMKVDLSRYAEKIWEWRGNAPIDAAPEGFVRLDELCEIFEGIRTSDNDVFVLKDVSWSGKTVEGFSRALGARVQVEAAICRNFLRGREIGRNAHAKITHALIFPYSAEDASRLIPWREFESSFPKAAGYFEKCRARLRAREHGEYDLSQWYGYIRNQNHDLMGQKKVMIQSMAPRAHFTFDSVGDRFFVTGYGLHIKAPTKRTDDHYVFLQALVKTARLDGRIISRTSKLKAGYEYRKQFMADLLVPRYDPKDKTHAAIVETQSELAAVARRRNMANGGVRGELEHRIAELEDKIERLASRLYDANARKAS
jgi:type I restriction-modification system DNA methylase subunit